MAAFLFHSLTRSLTSSSQNLSFSLAHCLSQPVRVSLCAHVLHFSCYYACSCHSFNFIYIAPRFCCCAMCIHTGLLNQTFISTSFVHSFVRLARSFVRSFPFSFLSSSSLLLLFCTSLPSGVCKYAHTYLTLLVDVLPACTLHTHLFATLLFSISFTLHRKFTSNCLDVGT